MEETLYSRMIETAISGNYATDFARTASITIALTELLIIKLDKTQLDAFIVAKKHWNGANVRDSMKHFLSILIPRVDQLSWDEEDYTEIASINRLVSCTLDTATGFDLDIVYFFDRLVDTTDLSSEVLEKVVSKYIPLIPEASGI